MNKRAAGDGPDGGTAGASEGVTTKAAEDGRPFLERWSARKADVQPDRPGESRRYEPAADGEAVAPVVPIAASDERLRNPVAEPDRDLSAEAVPVAPSDADMPPLDSLHGESDLSVFLGDGISAGLRKAALRRVFSAARFNVRDGLNDYDGDYTAFEPLGDTVTADMKFHAARRERLARERAEAEALAADESTDTPADDTASAPADEPADEPGGPPAEESLPSDEVHAESLAEPAEEPAAVSQGGGPAAAPDAGRTSRSPTELLPPT